MTRIWKTTTCQRCGKNVTLLRAKGGMPRKWCSDECRARIAYEKWKARAKP